MSGVIIQRARQSSASVGSFIGGGIARDNIEVAASAIRPLSRRLQRIVLTNNVVRILESCQLVSRANQ